MEGYAVNKKLILKAWARYRPNFSKNSYLFQKKKEEQKHSLLSEFWDESFLNLLLSDVELKQYDFKGFNNEVKRQKDFD